jgi:hypothetical protein
VQDRHLSIEYGMTYGNDYATFLHCGVFPLSSGNRSRNRELEFLCEVE